MVWFYERQGTFIRCETREASDHPGFEVLLIDPDGTEKVEYFADSQSLKIRQLELQSSLAHDGWQDPYGRTI